jgi:hypothetical protein
MLTILSPNVEIPSYGYSAEASVIWGTFDRIADQSSPSISLEPLISKFYNLALEWKKAKETKSSYSEMISHPAYLRIIGLGSQTIPLILAELKREPDYWFDALTALTGEDPIKAEDAGDLKKMSATWIEWGRNHGSIS